MASSFKLKYNIDIVFCVDCTQSMEKHMDYVKNCIKKFPDDTCRSFETKCKSYDQLRVRIIAFRDYAFCGKDAMLTTEFMKLPEETDAFEKVVDSLTAFGGTDVAEDGLEALAYAINSDWDTDGMMRSQVIVVFSDAPCHKLGFGRISEIYPKDMPKNLEELSSMWMSLPDSKRLVLYAPDSIYWNVISRNWDNVLQFPSEAGQGLKELEYSQILDVLCNSL